MMAFNHFSEDVCPPQTVNAELLAALEPFSKAAVAMDLEFPAEPDTSVYVIGPEVRRYGEWEKTKDCVDLTHGDFRRARAALSRAAAVKPSVNEDRVKVVADWLAQEFHLDPDDALYPLVERATALLAALAVKDRWEGIESAPKDGTAILFYDPNTESGGAVFEGHWDDGEWYDFADNFNRTPTHWRPLPPPPLQEETAG